MAKPLGLNAEHIRKLVANRPPDQKLWPRCRQVAAVAGCSTQRVYQIVTGKTQSKRYGDALTYAKVPDAELRRRLAEHRKALVKIDQWRDSHLIEIAAIRAELDRRGLPNGGPQRSGER